MSRLSQRTAHRRAAETGPAEAAQQPGRPHSPAVAHPQLTLRERARARRRLRYVRKLRELQLRDLGGLVFDLYRFGEKREPLVRDKLDRIVATDKEERALEELLGERRRPRDVRQPGVGGTCPSCGAFHGSDARYCAACGVELVAPAPPAVEPAPPAREWASELADDARAGEPASEAPPEVPLEPGAEGEAGEAEPTPEPATEGEAPPGSPPGEAAADAPPTDPAPEPRQ